MNSTHWWRVAIDSRRKRRRTSIRTESSLVEAGSGIKAKYETNGRQHGGHNINDQNSDLKFGEAIKFWSFAGRNRQDSDLGHCGSSWFDFSGDHLEPLGPTWLGEKGETDSLHGTKHVLNQKAASYVLITPANSVQNLICRSFETAHGKAALRVTSTIMQARTLM